MDIESEQTLTAIVAKVKAAILDDEEVAIAQLDARLEPMVDKVVQKLGDRLEGIAHGLLDRLSVSIHIEVKPKEGK